jgi:phage portal protein BeeE
LSRFVDHGSTLKPDLDHMTALSDERDAYWQRVAKAEFLSDAEKRALLGFDEE